MVKYIPKDFKTILNKYKFIDSWFWCRYSINPYNGCEFACTYCDSRSHKKMFVLCDKYKLNFRIKRYIPNDFRKPNYLIAQKLLDESYVSQMLGKPWANTFWAGQNISNLRESIQDIAARGELQKIRNVNPLIEESVLNLLRDSRKQRRNYELSR